MYRIAVDEVPDDDYEFPLGKADVLVEGRDVTLIGWGTQVHVLLEVAEIANKDFGISCEVIDLVSILPWDKQTVADVCSENSFCLLHLMWCLYAYTYAYNVLYNVFSLWKKPAVP